MNKFLRAIIAGYGAKKLGGGCFSTILIFIIIYWALGTCNKPAQKHSEMYKPGKTVTYIQVSDNKPSQIAFNVTK